MASASARRRSNKRLNSNSKPPKASMSPSASSSGPNYRKFVMITSLSLIGSLTILFSISSISGNALVSKVQHSNVYTVEVINEFPHDPAAFTQVRIIQSLKFNWTSFV